MHHDTDPGSTLAMAQDARRRLADRVVAPGWYTPLYGLGCGGLIASQALPGPGAAAGVIVSLLLIAGNYAVWSRRAGIVVNGYRSGATLPITLVLVAALLALLAIAAVARHRFGIAWAPLPCGIVAAVIGAWASRAWDARWRREMVGAL